MARLGEIFWVQNYMSDMYTLQVRKRLEIRGLPLENGTYFIYIFFFFKEQTPESKYTGVQILSQTSKRPAAVHL